ncbi:MAG: hypothetical protein ACI90V_000355 [Bacillariaceae sp.]
MTDPFQFNLSSSKVSVVVPQRVVVGQHLRILAAAAARKETKEVIEFSSDDDDGDIAGVPKIK